MQVSRMKNHKTTAFRTNLMGGFGAGFFSAPNMIDFSTVFNNIETALLDNAPVVFTVIGIIILYIPLLILCRRLDKKDLFKVIL